MREQITIFFSRARRQYFPNPAEDASAARRRRACVLVLLPGCLVWLAAIFLSGANKLLELPLFALAFAVCLLGSGLFFVRRLVPGLAGADRIVLAFLPGCAAVFLSNSLIVWFLKLCGIPDLPGAVYLLPCWLLGGYELLFRLLRNSGPHDAGQLPHGAGQDLHSAGRNPHNSQQNTHSAEQNLHSIVQNKRFAGQKAAVSLAFPVCATLSLCLMLHALYGIFPFAEAQRLKAWTYNQDMLWSIGNAAAARFGFPFQDLRVAGLTLNYHFGNDAVAGILSRAAGCSAWHGLCFYWNGAVLVLAVLGFACVGRRFFARSWGACCVAPVVYLCSTHGSGLPFYVFSNANAQDTACLALCGLLLLIVHAGEMDGRGVRIWARSLAAGLLCFSAACMIKSTVGLLVLLGLLSAVVVGAFTHQTRMGHLALLLGGGCGFGIVYGLVLSRAVNNLVFTEFSNLLGLPAAYWRFFPLLLLVMYFVSLPDSLLRFRTLPLPRLCVNAIAIGGMMAYVLYNHYSASQVYFALTAVPCAVFCAMPTAERLWAWAQSRLSRYRKAVWAVGAAALCLCFGLQCYQDRGYLRTGAQAVLRCMNMRESAAQELTVTDENWQAAMWLRENTLPGDVFLSNRNNRQKESGDGIFHFYSAASERFCYVESYRYAFDYDARYHEIRRRLETVSDAIYYTLPQQEAFALARAENIQYIVVDRLVSDAPQWDCPPVFENEYVSIYRSDAS